MEMTMTEQKNKIHPHKFLLWVSLASIIMMYAGLTSAYVVKSQLASWQQVALPTYFWYSTVAILLSSMTMQMALRSFKEREMNRYRLLIAATVVLGSLFVLLQYFGFQQLWSSGITFQGSGAGQFLYVIAGLHGLHVVGGMIALMVIFFKAFFGQTKTYSSIPVEVASIYWHFVDILWVYLLIFFIVIG